MTIGTSYAGTNYADGALAGWANPQNAYADDTNYVTVAGTTKNVWYGKLYGFPDISTIPDGSTINSVTLSAEWKNSAVDTAGPEFLLSYSLGGTVASGTTDTTGGTAFEVLSYSVPSLSAAQLKSTGTSGFLGVIRFRRTDNTTHTASVDYVRAVYDYTVTATIAEATQEQYFDNSSLTASYPIIISEAVQIQVIEDSSLTNSYPINIAEATQEQVIENSIITYQEPSLDVTISESVQLQIFEDTTILASYPVTIAEGVQLQVFENTSISSIYLIIVSENTQQQVFENTTITSSFPLVISENTQLQIFDNTEITLEIPSYENYYVDPVGFYQEQIFENSIPLASYHITLQEAFQLQSYDDCLVSVLRTVPSRTRVGVFDNSKIRVRSSSSTNYKENKVIKVKRK